MDKEAAIRILQLKNNFYRDEGGSGSGPLGDYCVLGYFDAFDIHKMIVKNTKEINTWNFLGELTAESNGTMKCRMLVCFIENQEKDEVFWDTDEEAFYFITLIRVNKSDKSAEQLEYILQNFNKNNSQIGYWSYDHSEIIVVTKTNQYSMGIQSVMELRKVCCPLKMYTIFSIPEKILDSYELIQEKIEDEKICCRLHCMVKDYDKAEEFKERLQKHMEERNSCKVELKKFETFGGYDWLMEMNDISIHSIIECYKTKELLTHANPLYSEAFYNIESEILVKQESEENDRKLD